MTSRSVDFRTFKEKIIKTDKVLILYQSLIEKCSQIKRERDEFQRKLYHYEKELTLKTEQLEVSEKDYTDRLSNLQYQFQQICQEAEELRKLINEQKPLENKVDAAEKNKKRKSPKKKQCNEVVTVKSEPLVKQTPDYSEDLEELRNENEELKKDIAKYVQENQLIPVLQKNLAVKTLEIEKLKKEKKLLENNFNKKTKTKVKSSLKKVLEVNVPSSNTESSLKSLPNILDDPTPSSFIKDDFFISDMSDEEIDLKTENLKCDIEEKPNIQIVNPVSHSEDEDAEVEKILSEASKVSRLVLLSPLNDDCIKINKDIEENNETLNKRYDLVRKKKEKQFKLKKKLNFVRIKRILRKSENDNKCNETSVLDLDAVKSFLQLMSHIGGSDKIENLNNSSISPAVRRRKERTLRRASRLFKSNEKRNRYNIGRDRISVSSENESNLSDVESSNREMSSMTDSCYESCPSVLMKKEDDKSKELPVSNFADGFHNSFSGISLLDKKQIFPKKHGMESSVLVPNPNGTCTNLLGFDNGNPIHNINRNSCVKIIQNVIVAENKKCTNTSSYFADDNSGKLVRTQNGCNIKSSEKLIYDLDTKMLTSVSSIPDSINETYSEVNKDAPKRFDESFTDDEDIKSLLMDSTTLRTLEAMNELDDINLDFKQLECESLTTEENKSTSVLNIEESKKDLDCAMNKMPNDNNLMLNKEIASEKSEDVDKRITQSTFIEPLKELDDQKDKIKEVLDRKILKHSSTTRKLNKKVKILNGRPSKQYNLRSSDKGRKIFKSVAIIQDSNEESEEEKNSINVKVKKADKVNSSTEMIKQPEYKNGKIEQNNCHIPSNIENSPVQKVSLPLVRDSSDTSETDDADESIEINNDHVPLNSNINLRDDAKNVKEFKNLEIKLDVNIESFSVDEDLEIKEIFNKEDSIKLTAKKNDKMDKDLKGKKINFVKSRQTSTCLQSKNKNSSLKRNSENSSKKQLKRPIESVCPIELKKVKFSPEVKDTVNAKEKALLLAKKGSFNNVPIKKRVGGFKRPILVKTVPACPESPTPETELIVTEPVIIPLEKPEIISIEKATEYFNQLVIYSNEENALAEVIRHFKSQEPEHIASLITMIVSGDTQEPESKYPETPPLTQLQRSILGFISRIERSGLDDLHLHCLKEMEMKLYSNVELLNIFPLARIYVAICRSRFYIDRIRRTCLEAFYFMGDLAIPFFFIVLKTWLEVLPKYEECKDYPMARLIVQLIYSKACQENGYCLTPLKDLLNIYYGYPKEKWDDNNMFQELLTLYLHNPTRPNNLSLLVYCKNCKTDWVYEKVKTEIKPLIEKAKSDNFKASLIILICHVMSQFKAEEDHKNLRDVRQWISMIIKGNDVSDVLRQSVFLLYRKLPKLSKTMRAKLEMASDNNL